MKKISKIILSITLLLICMPLVTETLIKANTEIKEITINGTVGLDYIEWIDSYEFSIFMKETGNSNNNLNEIVKSKNRKFEFKVQIPYGSTKEYDIGQNIPLEENSIKGVVYDKNNYHLTITVNDEGETTTTIESNSPNKPKKINKDVINLDSIQGIGTTFKNKYNSKVSLIAGTNTTLNGGTWDKGTILSYAICESLESNCIKGSSSIQKNDSNKETFSFGTSFNVYANSETIEHRYIKKNDSKLRSVISDSRVYEVWYKIKDHGDGTNEVSYSFDNSNFISGYIADVSFEDFYFKRAIEVEYSNGNTNETSLELYEYTDGEASLSNTSKSFVNNFMIKDGKLVIDVKEGKYFFVEKSNQKTDENTIYSFDVTRDNYKEKKVFKINKQEAEQPEETPENPTINPEKDNDSNIIKAGVKTADETNYMANLLVMICSLYGVVHFGKKIYVNKR